MINGVGSGNIGDEPGQPTLLFIVVATPMMDFDPVKLE